MKKLQSCQRERSRELSNLDEHLVVFQTFLLVLKKVIPNPFCALQLALSTILNELPKVTASFCNFFGMLFNIQYFTSSCTAHNRLSHHNNYLKCINRRKQSLSWITCATWMAAIKLKTRTIFRTAAIIPMNCESHVFFWCTLHKILFPRILEILGNSILWTANFHLWWLSTYVEG